MARGGADAVPCAATPAQTDWRRNLWIVAAGSFATNVGMTLLIPFLPLYVRELGVNSDADVLRWSGIAFGATFLTAALAAPLWGALGDRFGRKPMLIRASLGMAVTMSLIGFAQTVWQLVALRLLVGLLGGYSSAATILVAAQAPKERTAWALGVLSSGMLAGAVAGPLLGGILPGAIGIRATFMLTGALIFCAFLATALLLHGDVRQGPRPLTRSASGQPSRSPAHSVVVLLITASMLMFATMAIEPIVAAYVTQINGPDRAIAWSGLVLALGATGSILSAPIVGRMADRVGHRRVVVGCLGTAAVCVLLQGHVANAAQLAATQLALGVCLGGLMPSVTASIRHITPPDRLGRTLGLGVSAQYVGLVLGPVTGGFVAAQTGFRSVFLVTALVLVLAAALNLAEARSRLPRSNGRAVALGPRLRRSAR